MTATITTNGDWDSSSCFVMHPWDPRGLVFGQACLIPGGLGCIAILCYVYYRTVLWGVLVSGFRLIDWFASIRAFGSRYSYPVRVYYG